jgi:hypothetical protein
LLICGCICVLEKAIYFFVSWPVVSIISSTTWDEHVFEITLPRSCCIGHVDLKFSLHAPCPSPPHIQVTLLKQNASGIGRKEKMFTPSVDEPIDFNINMQFDGSTKGIVTLFFCFFFYHSVSPNSEYLDCTAVSYLLAKYSLYFSHQLKMVIKKYTVMFVHESLIQDDITIRLA